MSNQEAVTEVPRDEFQADFLYQMAVMFLEKQKDNQLISPDEYEKLKQELSCELKPFYYELD